MARSISPCFFHNPRRPKLNPYLQAWFPAGAEGEPDHAIYPSAVQIDHLLEMIVKNRLIPIVHFASLRMHLDMPDGELSIRYGRRAAGVHPHPGIASRGQNAVLGAFSRRIRSVARTSSIASLRTGAQKDFLSP
jgi:hypothetical protein